MLLAQKRRFYAYLARRQLPKHQLRNFQRLNNQKRQLIRSYHFPSGHFLVFYEEAIKPNSRKRSIKAFIAARAWLSIVAPPLGYEIASG